MGAAKWYPVELKTRAVGMERGLGRGAPQAGVWGDRSG
jgi:hypothetical protein